MSEIDDLAEIAEAFDNGRRLRRPSRKLVKAERSFFRRSQERRLTPLNRMLSSARRRKVHISLAGDADHKS